MGATWGHKKGRRQSPSISFLYSSMGLEKRKPPRIVSVVPEQGLELIISSLMQSRLPSWLVPWQGQAEGTARCPDPRHPPGSVLSQL